MSIIKATINTVAIVEIKMLLSSQCPGQRDCVFSIRNPSGSVGILLDAENKETRRLWVSAIQYQLAVTSPDVSFPPLEFSPPVGGMVPDTRVLFCGKLDLLCTKRSSVGVWNTKYFQLLPRELVYFQAGGNDDYRQGVVLIERLNIFDEDEKSSFKVKSASGITLVLDADSQETKSMWLVAIRKQVQSIENMKLKVKTAPKEETNENAILVKDKIAQFYDDEWGASAIAGETEQYLRDLVSPGSSTNQPVEEFSYDVVTPAGGAGVEDGVEQGNDNNEHTTNTSDNRYATAAAYNSTIDTTNTSNTTNISTNHTTTTTTTSSTYSRNTPISQHNPNDQSTAPPVTSTSLTVTALNKASNNTQPAVAAATHAPHHSSTSSSSSTTSSSSGVKVRGNHSSRSSSSRGGHLQTRGFDPKRSLINPKLILGALKAPQAQAYSQDKKPITHRFVLILEFERRTDLLDAPAWTESSTSYTPTSASTPSPLLTPTSRFSVGGPRACKDPRNCPLSELLGISNKKPEIQLPMGWLMLHQYIYIIQQNTDEHGWQYRSKWSNGLINGRGEEQWSEAPGENKMVRRRLWMTTVVKKNDLGKAKKIIAESLGVNTKGEQAILQGTLYRHQLPIATDGATTSTIAMATANSVWQKVKVLLFHSRVELFVGNDKRGDYLLQDCEVKMFYDHSCFGRPYSFSLRNFSGSVNLILDAGTQEKRRQWVTSVHYQLSIISPDLNFQPFVSGPPVGQSLKMRVLMCGELGMLVDQGMRLFYFELEPSQLRYYERSVLKGRLFLNQMVVSTHRSVSRDDDSNSDFIIRIPGTMAYHLRAANPEDKHTWVRSIKRQQVKYVEGLRQRQKVMDATTAVAAEAVQIVAVTDTDTDADTDADVDVGVGNASTGDGQHQLFLMMTPSEHKMHHFYDPEWTAPEVDPTDEEVLNQLDVRREEEDTTQLGTNGSAGGGEHINLDFADKHTGVGGSRGKTKLPIHQQQFRSLLGTTGTTGSNASQSSGDNGDNPSVGGDSVMGDQYSTISSQSNDIIPL